MSQDLKNRLKSFCWRTGMMVVALAVQFALDNLTAFQLGTETTVVLGLVLGEISKYLNTAK